MFKPGGDESSEMIFAVQNLGGASTAYGMPVHYIANRASYGGCINCLVPSVELVDMYEYKDGRPFDWDELFPGFSTNKSIKEKVFYSTFDEKGQYVAAYPENVDKLRKMYSERDPRMESTIILPYTENLYKGWVNNAKKDCEMVLAPSNPANETYGYCRNAFGHNTYLYRKFTPEYDMDGLIADRFHSPVNFPIIRYADVLLMYAEAKTELGEIDNSVYQAINEVRQRKSVNMPPVANKNQSELRSIIRKERKCEFAWEGLRWSDIRRWGIAENVMNKVLYGRPPRDYLHSAPKIDENGTPDYSVVPNKNDMRVIELRSFNKDRDYVLPIPRIEIETNTALKQNPNY